MGLYYFKDTGVTICQSISNIRQVLEIGLLIEDGSGSEAAMI